MARVTRLPVAPDRQKAIEHAADTALDRLGRWLAARFDWPSAGYHPCTPSDDASLCRTLAPGDVLLVGGASGCRTRSSI